MLRIQQGLGIACTRSVPTVHALFHEVELAPVVIVPCAEYLVAALSHHVDAEFPVFIVDTESDAVSDIGSRVAYHGTVGSGDFTVTVHILELQVARCNGGQGVLGRPGDFFVCLVHAFHLVTVEVTDRITGHRIALALVAGDD